jgi:site-specific recombinase XerD
MENPEPIRLPVSTAPDPGTKPSGVWEILRRWKQFADLDPSEKSSREYRYWCVRFMADTLVDIRTARLRTSWTTWAQSPGMGRPDTRPTAIRHFFRWYVGMGYRPDNPTAVLPRFRRKRRNPQWFTQDELNQVLVAAAYHNPV